MSNIEYVAAEYVLCVPSVSAGTDEADAVCSRWVAKSTKTDARWQ